MDKRILLLRLEGPLQSWGERSKWDSRDSAYMPTKSGVLGLIACAMGADRDDPALGELNERIAVSVRADRPGEMTSDFQTVSGILRTAEGGERGKKGEITTLISRRQYLEDASFLVAITGDDETLERCREALTDPVWTVYLGRKNCPPTKPVLIGVTGKYGSVEEAFLNEPLAERSEAGNILCETEDANGNMLRNDVLIGGRIFRGRTVYERTLEVKA